VFAYNYEDITLQNRMGWRYVIRFLAEVMSGCPFFADVLIGLGAHSSSFPM